MNSKGEKKEKITEDPRFSGIHNDPKFRSTKSKNFKIKLDDRFSKQDLEVRRKAKVDKYGRKIVDANKDVKDFDRYFTKEKPEDKEDESNSSESSDDQEAEAAVHAKSVDRARGEPPADYVSSSDEESSSESEEESGDSDIESEEIELEESKPASGNATNTLAVVNLDWDHVKSADLFVTFKSFVPKGGEIQKLPYIQVNLVKKGCNVKRSKVLQKNYSSQRNPRRMIKMMMRLMSNQFMRKETQRTMILKHFVVTNWNV